MEIYFVASDSQGTRSMATFIKTKDINIFIDPGVALGPSRYGLPPHKIEVQRLEEHWKLIKKFLKDAEVVFITHYHYDHHNPQEPEVLKDKILYIKDPEKNINQSQKQRAKFFLDQLGNLPKKIEIAEEKKLKFGNTIIITSKAVPHGITPRLGYVFEIFIDDGKDTFIFSSDIQGPALDEQFEFIYNHPAKVIYIDGPMTYQMHKYGRKNLEKSIENLIKIITSNKNLTHLVMDHHFLRDLKWRERIKEVFKEAEKNQVKVVSAALFMGKEEELLEARRKELYEKEN